MKKIKHKKPQLIESITSINSWDEWLREAEDSLGARGYRKYKQNLKNEDFAYWKSFHDSDDNKIYHVGLFFYDLRKFNHLDEGGHERIGVQFICMLNDSDGRIDLSVSKDITLEHFESMSLEFYNSISKYCSK